MIPRVLIVHAIEDAEKAELLSTALQRSGVATRRLTGDVDEDAKRLQELSEPDKLRCVIVIWSRHYIEQQNGIFPDLISDSNELGRLIPVTFKKMRMPDHFHHRAFANLIGWRGSERNVYFQDLLEKCQQLLRGDTDEVGALRAKPKRPITLMTALPMAAIFIGFWADVASVQKQVCSVQFVQPRLSDFCGALGLGNKPTKVERLAWEDVDQNSCVQLGAYIRDYSHGAYTSIANALLSVASLEESEVWTSKQKPQVMTLELVQEPKALERQAKRQAAMRIEELAAQRCSNFAASTDHRLSDVKVENLSYQCAKHSDGYRCSVVADTTCVVDVRSITNCGAQ
jgi:hypothetical protein